MIQSRQMHSCINLLIINCNSRRFQHDQELRLCMCSMLSFVFVYFATLLLTKQKVVFAFETNFSLVCSQSLNHCNTKLLYYVCRSRNSSNTSGRRSTGRMRKNHARPHLGIQTLPGHDARHATAGPPDSMLVDEQGFVRFRHLQDLEAEKPKRIKKQNNEVNHYSDA